VVLDFLAYVLTPKAQAVTFDKGYFYPGPAVKNVDLTLAPSDSQSALQKFLRPQYDQWIKQYPVEIALDTTALNAAFDKWDRDIGGGGGRYHG
jgi:putative spermidine/putrescine transport system substrate-binding protein